MRHAITCPGGNRRRPCGIRGGKRIAMGWVPLNAATSEQVPTAEGCGEQLLPSLRNQLGCMEQTQAVGLWGADSIVAEKRRLFFGKEKRELTCLLLRVFAMFFAEAQEKKRKEKGRKHAAHRMEPVQVGARGRDYSALIQRRLSSKAGRRLPARAGSIPHKPNTAANSMSEGKVKVLTPSLISQTSASGRTR